MIPGRSTYSTGRIIQCSRAAGGRVCLPLDALYYAKKVLMETRVSLTVGLYYLRMKRCAQQVSFADSNDGPIVERCQHLHRWPNPFNGRAANEEGVERSFSYFRHREISLKTFSLTAKCITTNANVHRCQQRLARKRIVRLARQ